MGSEPVARAAECASGHNGVSLEAAVLPPIRLLGYQQRLKGPIAYPSSVPQ